MAESWLMLAPSKSVTEEQLRKLRYPLLVSPKIDGIRGGVKREGPALLTRSALPVPNLHAKRLLEVAALAGFDGELTVGEPFGDDVMRRSSSGLMSRDGEPDVRYHAFDLHGAPEGWGFERRLDRLSERVSCLSSDLRRIVRAVQHVECWSPDDVLTREAEWVEKGYEGVMLRDPLGPYVQWKRTTLKQANVLKLKRFEDCEALVVGWEEEMENTNEVGSRGRRTSHKAGLVPKGRLGALVVRALNGRFQGEEFSVGSGPGFAGDERDRLWADREKGLRGMVASVRYFPTGTVDKPRFPTFRGFRVPGT